MPEFPILLKHGRPLSARPDTVDFRDLLFVPTLREVPSERTLDTFLAEANHEVRVLDQGAEGACTGFALAAVANHLLRTRKVYPDDVPVSARMFYEMARRHDEWPGDDYAGSSARGAVKGWHKSGVCSEKIWPYVPGQTSTRLTTARIREARQRPLGAYFRVNHRDLVALHAALAETGILMATAMVHGGWDTVGGSGVIRWTGEALGGHAFAIVGYDREGLWIQNSWGPGWGRGGFGRLSYDDWLAHGTDVWVCRLGAAVQLDSAAAYGSSTLASTRMGQNISFADLRPHVISVGNDGLPQVSGDFANSPEEVRSIVRDDFPELTAGWKKKRLLLYAHGGLVPGATAVQRVAEYRAAMMKAEVYPLAFVWHSDFWTTLKNILTEALTGRRAEGLLDRAQDFMLDRLDATLEPLARLLGGRAQWKEMKENALAASRPRTGAAALVVATLEKLLEAHPDLEIHLAGHSAGAVFLGPVLRRLAAFTSVRTCTLWAPACTCDFFKEQYLPHLTGANARLRHLAVYTLSDPAEQDDHCARMYHKSLLYLISRALEDEYRPFDFGWKGHPLLGLERCLSADPVIRKLFRPNGKHDWIVSPNDTADPLLHADARAHGAFDDDPATVRGTLQRILGRAAAPPAFSRSAASRRDRRQTLDRLTESPRT